MGIMKQPGRQAFQNIFGIKRNLNSAFYELFFFLSPFVGVTVFKKTEYFKGH